MKTQDVKALHEKKEKDLKTLLQDSKKKVFELGERMRKGQEKNLHALRNIRKDIARINTELSIKRDGDK